MDPSKIAFVSLAAMANQAKPLRGVTPSRRSKVCRSGRSWFTNRAMAHVRTPGGPTSPTQRLFRVARSSPNLCARSSLTRSNRRWYGPVCPVVWEGWRREASPYPDLGREARLRGSPREGPESAPKPSSTMRPLGRAAKAEEIAEVVAFLAPGHLLRDRRGRASLGRVVGALRVSSKME